MALEKSPHPPRSAKLSKRATVEEKIAAIQGLRRSDFDNLDGPALRRSAKTLADAAAMCQDLFGVRLEQSHGRKR